MLVIAVSLVNLVSWSLCLFVSFALICSFICAYGQFDLFLSVDFFV